MPLPLESPGGCNLIKQSKGSTPPCLRPAYAVRLENGTPAGAERDNPVHARISRIHLRSGRPGRRGAVAVSRAILVLGLMGCGKTTVGAALAERLGRSLWDGDSQLQELTGMTAAQLGAERGIDVLHGLEFEVLALGLARRPLPVVAAAAAVVLDPRLPGVIGEAWTVWLRVEVTHLAARLQYDDGHRPLLTGDLLATLREMARIRDPLYAQVADLTLDATRVAPAALVGRIVEAMPAGV